MPSQTGTQTLPPIRQETLPASSTHSSTQLMSGLHADNNLVCNLPRLLMCMFTSSSFPHHTSIGQSKLDLCTFWQQSLCSDLVWHPKSQMPCLFTVTSDQHQAKLVAHISACDPKGLWCQHFPDYLVVCCMQRSPCAAHIPADDPNFTTTMEEQEERLMFIAQYTDAVIRAKLLGDSAAANYVMHEVPSSPLVQAADISPGCFGATRQTASH